MDILLECISFGLFAGSAIMIFFSWNSLPPIIPSHFNFKNEVDGHGSKNLLFIPVGISFAVYILLSVLAKNPQFYDSRMSGTNRKEQYRLTTKMLISLKTVLMFILLVISFMMLQSARLKMLQYLNYLLIFIPLVIFPYVLYWLIRYRRIQ